MFHVKGPKILKKKKHAQLTYIKNDGKTGSSIMWVVTQDNLSLGFPTRSYSNQPAQLQRLARIVNFHL